MKKEDKKPAYILCPRCELNYIDVKEKYCTVCKAEMGLVDPSILLPDDEEAGLEKLCPVCQVNYIGEDEDICFLCLKEREEREAAEEKSEWDAMERDSDDMSPIGILPLDDEPLLDDDEPEEDEETVPERSDDFDYPDTFDGFDEDDEEFDDDEDEDELDDDDE